MKKTIDALFGSKTRIKLLRLFLNSSDREFYVREISREIDEQVHSVRRELSNLQGVGVVKSTAEDRKIYYSINRDHQIFPALYAIFAGGEMPKAAPTAEPSSVGGEWGEKISPIISDVDILLIAGELVGDGKSQIDMILVGENKDGGLSKWASWVEQDFEKGLRYSIMTPEEFYYRYSTGDIFIKGIFENPHEVILDKQNIIKE